jgi:hypothetical protein
MNERPRWIRIEAPDGDTAFALERRLAHVHACAVARRDSWLVEVEDFDDQLEEIGATVRHWLRTIGACSTVLHVDGETRTVACRTERETLLAEGYDGGGVLEHEP